MFKTEIGVKVYEAGDQGTIRTGKVVYTVQGVNERGELIVASNNTGRKTVLESSADFKLTLSVRNQDGGSETGGNDEAKALEEHMVQEQDDPERQVEDRDEYLKARSLAFGHLVKAEGKVRLPMSEASTYSKIILGALQGAALYLGTVSPRVKAKRRARGKVAKASRKGNRK